MSEVTSRTIQASVQRNKKIFFFVILSVTGFFTFKVLQSFVSVIFLSLIYSILVRPMYEELHKYFKSERIASVTTLILSFLMIFVPVLLVIHLFLTEAISFRESILTNLPLYIRQAENSYRLIFAFIENIPFLSSFVNIESFSTAIRESVKNISSILVTNSVAIGSSTAIFVTNFFIFLILIYFMVPALPQIKKFLEDVSPLDNTIDRLYIERAISMITSMVKGTFVVAVAQGLLGALFLWIAGVDYLLTLTLGMIILSVIPLLGTAMITIPISFILFLNGQFVPALIVFLGQMIIVSNIDNILRAELVSKETSLHPALMLLSILGGISVFGVWGFLYGPVVMILFVTSIEIYLKHLKY